MITQDQAILRTVLQHLILFTCEGKIFFTWHVTKVVLHRHVHAHLHDPTAHGSACLQIWLISSQDRSN